MLDIRFGIQDTCQKCGSTSNLTPHHIEPQRHFKDSLQITLCRDPCHNNIERLIVAQKREKDYYWNILYFFLLADEVTYPVRSINSMGRQTWCCHRCNLIQKPRRGQGCTRCVVGTIRPVTISLPYHRQQQVQLV